MSSTQQQGFCIGTQASAAIHAHELHTDLAGNRIGNLIHGPCCLSHQSNPPRQYGHDIHRYAVIHDVHHSAALASLESGVLQAHLPVAMEWLSDLAVTLLTLPLVAGSSPSIAPHKRGSWLLVPLKRCCAV